MKADEEGDSQLMQFIAIYLWAGTYSEIQWHSGENAYHELFRKELLDNHPSAEEAHHLLEIWVTAMEEVAGQLAQLVKYLSGGTGSEPSLHYPTSRKITDDYRAVLLSLRVQPHFLALLLKFRVLCKREWHEQFSVPFPYNAKLINPIQDLIKRVKEGINDTQLEMERIREYANDLLEKTQSFLPDGDTREISMLEVIERLQLLSWNRGSKRYATFSGRWNYAGELATPDEFVSCWSTWDSGFDFIYQITFSRNKTNFCYLLKEYEWNLGTLAYNFSPDLHFPSSSFEVEHIFAERIHEDKSFEAIGGFSAYDLENGHGFEDNLLHRSGNLLFLPQACNKAVGNNLSKIKAANFSNCQGHQSGSGEAVSSHLHTVARVGNQMSPLGNNHSHIVIRWSCAVLALFALQRFFYPRK